MAPTDRQACTVYCENHKDFSGSQTKIRACQVGQLSYIYSGQSDSADSLRGCEQCFEDPALSQACKLGVAAEELRTSKYRKSYGKGQDRETGN